jgi:hypothetical protein
VCYIPTVANDDKEGHVMRLIVSALLLAGSVAISTTAFAGADDVKWIAQCMKDNKDAKVSAEVIHKYCACMNNKMDDNETLSITQWEKTHATERTACDKESGWK